MWSSGNLERDRLLRAAVAAYGDDREAVRASLPGDFDAGEDEISAVLADMEGPKLPDVHFYPDGKLQPTSGSDLAFDPQTGMTLAPVPRESAPVPSPVHTPQPTTDRKMTHAEAIAELQAADMALAEYRRQVRITTAAVSDAKGRLQQEIEKHVAANPNRLTSEMNARNYAQASLEARRQRALKYGTGISQTANDFVRSRMIGFGPHRGGQTQRQRARTGFTVPGSPAAAAVEYKADDHRGLLAPGKPVLPERPAPRVIPVK